MQLQVIPGILEKDWSRIEAKLEQIKTFTNIAHIDIIDGKFADNLTFLDPEPFKKYSSELFLELHMMVENPIEYIKSWADAGFKRFLGHIEHMQNQEEFLRTAKEFGEAGLAIDGPTSIFELTAPFSSIETLLFLDVTAGFSGQKFKDAYLSKIRELKKKGFSGNIEADGGINDKTIMPAKDAGANRFVATSFIWKAEHPKMAYEKLNALCSSL